MTTGRILLEPFVAPLDLTIPPVVRPFLDLALMSVVLFITNNAVMNFGFIRHRWRSVIVAARILALGCAAIFVAWPMPVLYLAFAFSLVNGFVDPRLHLESINRNKGSFLKKWFFSIGALMHHVGSAFIVANLFRPITSSNESVFIIPIPVVITVFLEILSWTIHISVIQRTAPKFFFKLLTASVGSQTVSLVVTMLFVKAQHLSVSALACTVFGNTAFLVSTLTGDAMSTHERKGMRESDSVARLMHKKNPLTEDWTAVFREATAGRLLACPERERKIHFQTDAMTSNKRSVSV